jgi:FkbM family methyltransferase
MHKKLIKKFDKENVFDIALSNEDGNGKMKIPYIEGEDFNTRLTLEKSFDEKGETSNDKIEVNTRKIDSFVKEKGVEKIDMIKIDVEGHEHKVLAGG